MSSPSGVSFAMALFGEWAELANFDGLSDIREFFHVQDELWDAVSIHLGQMGEHIRLVAALPGSAITAACGLTVMPDGAALSPIQATQVGLVWRMARRITAFHAGTLEENFVDVDPWATSVTTQGEKDREKVATPTSSGVKERVLKMSNLLDQSDDSELLSEEEPRWRDGLKTTWC